VTPISSPKTILVLESTFELGGAERITFDILQRVDKGHFRTVICTLYSLGTVGQQFREAGFCCQERLIRHRFDPRAFLHLRNLARRHKVDLIYFIVQPLTIFWALVLRNVLGIPVIGAIHNIPVFESSISRIAFTKSVSALDHVIAVANDQKQYLVSSLRVPEHKITVVRNGIDPSLWNHLKERQECGETVVGIVARLVPLKGIDVFLRAASLALTKEQSLSFWILGDGPELARLQALAAQLELREKVRFLGWVSDVRSVISRFSIAVSCSRTEAMPMVLLEYMAVRKAVIATRVGAVPELIEDGKSGLIIDADDPEALASCILRLSQDPAEALRMGENARARVNAEFNISRTVRDTESVWLKALGTRPAR